MFPPLCQSWTGFISVHLMLDLLKNASSMTRHEPEPASGVSSALMEPECPVVLVAVTLWTVDRCEQVRPRLKHEDRTLWNLVWTPCRPRPLGGHECTAFFFNQMTILKKVTVKSTPWIPKLRLTVLVPVHV